jgi:outer membrane protein TolC
MDRLFKKVTADRECFVVSAAARRACRRKSGKGTALAPVLLLAMLVAGWDGVPTYAADISFGIYSGGMGVIPKDTANATAAGFPAGPLVLSRAIELALANNPNIAALRWEVDGAEAQVDLAAGERLPRLKAAGGYLRHNDAQRLVAATDNNEPGLFGKDIVSGELIFTLPLFTGGRLVSQVKAAELLKIAADRRLARSRDELVFNVSSVFFSILAQERIVESLLFSRETLEEHLKRVVALMAQQKAAKVDRLRTEVRLADIGQRLVREKNAMAIQYRALANLIGLEAHEKAISIRGDLILTPGISLPDVEMLLAMAKSQRGDYLAARSALDAQARIVDAARAGHLPSISLVSSYGLRGSVGNTIGPEKLKNPEDIGRIGIALDIPLFEGGIVKARIRDQLAKLASAEERLRRLDSQIRLEVETALLNVASSQERIHAIGKAIEQAEESYRIVRQKYDLGKGAIVDVLDAQAALLDSRTNHDRALADHHTANAQLRLASGGEL